MLAKLPPCEESLKQHVRRAAWQTRIWISSHIAKPDLGSPLEYGWKREGEKLVPVYYEGLSASEVMQDLLCTCSKRNLCGTDSCSCRKNRLACVEMSYVMMFVKIRFQHNIHQTVIQNNSVCG